MLVAKMILSGTKSRTGTPAFMTLNTSRGNSCAASIFFFYSEGYFAVFLLGCHVLKAGAPKLAKDNKKARLNL